MSSFPLGIDVSHHNGVIDWSAAARSGIAFAYAKATEGLGWSDRAFRANWAGAHSAGLLRGAYHFFHPACPAAGQADRFAAAVGALGPGDLPPMLDLEETSPAQDEWPTVPRRERLSRVLQWLERVEQALGKKPVIYTRHGFVEDVFGGPGPLAAYPLWIAHYTEAARPDVPTDWPAWTFWQYSDRGRLPGVSSKLDFDRFSGTLEELLTLAGC